MYLSAAMWTVELVSCTAANVSLLMSLQCSPANYFGHTDIYLSTAKNRMNCSD